MLNHRPACTRFRRGKLDTDLRKYFREIFNREIREPREQDLDANF
jgi:hypothetical protein